MALSDGRQAQSVGMHPALPTNARCQRTEIHGPPAPWPHRDDRVFSDYRLPQIPSPRNKASWAVGRDVDPAFAPEISEWCDTCAIRSMAALRTDPCARNLVI